MAAGDPVEEQNTVVKSFLDDGNVPITGAGQSRMSLDDMYSKLQSEYRQKMGQGLFGRMNINPQAAQMLPQTEGARILGMGKSGMALLGGTNPEFPFAAWAQQNQRQQPSSVNTKQMEEAAKKLAVPDTDPRIKQNISNRFNDTMRNDYENLANKYGGPEWARMLETNTAHGAQAERDLNDFNGKMDFYNNLAEMGKRLGTDFDEIQKNYQAGYTIRPEALEAQKQFNDMRYDNVTPTTDLMDKFNKTDEKFQATQNIDAIIKQKFPANMLLNKSFAIKSGKDGSGKPITIIEATENDPTTGTPVLGPEGKVKTENITEQVRDRMNSAMEEHPELKKYGYDEDKLMRDALYILPNAHQETIREEPKPTIINTGNQKEVGSVYQGTQTISYGGKNNFHTDVDNFSLPETNVQLGNVENVIPSTHAEGQTADISGNTKIGEVILAPMAVVDGKLVMIPNENKSSTKNLFYAPMAVAQKPKMEYQTKVDPITKQAVKDPATGNPEVTKVATDETETYYIPLNQVANALKSKASGEEKGTEMENAIDIPYQQAQEMNDASARGTGKDDFQKYFSITKYTTTQQKGRDKKTKETERVAGGAQY